MAPTKTATLSNESQRTIDRIGGRASLSKRTYEFPEESANIETNG